ncbi:MAG: GNAT family N-acetyltransferase [Myxococcaceae bacterium]|nr:GNAT family N-acetyltransferase [Myxococcaceae bacterium]
MTGLPLSVRVVNSVGAIPKAAWNALVRPEHPPVLRWEWLDALESSGSTVARTGWEPCHFTAWRGETLVGLAPAFLKHHSMGEYVYDFAWANAAARVGVEYYPKLLVGIPLSPLTCPRFVAAHGESEALIRATLLEAALTVVKEEQLSSLHVIFPPEPEAKELEGLGLFRRAGLQYHWKNQGYATYADFLGRFDSKRRHQLKRERGAAATQGVHLRTVRGAELSDTHARLAFRFYEATVSKNGWGQLQLNRGFFERAFAALPGSIELVVAEKGGEVIAGAFNLASKTRLWGRYWGCFEELPFLHFHVCLYHSIDECIALGRQVFEPGAGGEHKVPRGFPPTLIHSAHHVSHPQLSAALARACARERVEAEAMARDGEALAGMKPITPSH